ncbi:DUF4184 family protein [Pontibacter locisalis]|uniref:DUF4184 family protein n=1 Tax=Pontibacter locisalis TaxID=1719035 RepID=A0ABW5IN24_9BACT
MPFTFSHPAAVLPLRLLPQKWTSLTGLVIGSIIPDFEKFLKMEAGNTYSHTWHGLLWFNLPLGILLSFLFHGVVRDPLLENLPPVFKRKLLWARSFNWFSYFRRNSFVVLASLLIGSVSHLCWDSLTHQESLAIKLAPVLAETVKIGDYKIRLFKMLDLLSSVLGLLFIIYVILQFPATKSQIRPTNTFGIYWLLVLVTTFLIIICRILFGLDLTEPWSLLFTSISAGLIGIINASLLVKHISRLLS